VEIFFHNQRVRIVQVEPAFVPVERFEVSTYWQRYYRSKPFFGERARFASVTVNTDRRLNAVSRRNGSLGEFAVTGGAASKIREARTGRGSVNGRVFANANICPASQKNCQMPGRAKLSVKGMNKAATGAGAVQQRTATAGSLTNGGAVTGSIGSKGSQKKKCQPGMACVQGANGANIGASGAGASPAQ